MHPDVTAIARGSSSPDNQCIIFKAICRLSMPGTFIPKRPHGRLVPLPANKDRKSYAAIATGTASSIWHFAMTFATDFEVQLNG